MIIQIIQLTDKIVTCASFRSSGKSVVPVSGFRRSFENDAELKLLLEENLLSTAEDTRTILALPSVQISLRELQLSMLDRKKLRAILPLELAGEIAAEGVELVCDALPLADGSLLAGWSAVSAIVPMLHLLTEAGQEPEVVTCPHLAWHFLMQHEGQEVVALVDDNALMVCCQGKPVFCRAMRTDAATIARSLAALELAKGISVANVYRLEGNPLPGEQRVPLPDQLAGQNPNGDLPENALISPLAMALAYCSGEIFNLRTGPLAWTGKRSHFLKQFRLPLVLGGLVLLLLLAESGLRWYLLTQDISSVNSSINKMYREIFPARKKAVDETAELKAEIRRLQKGVASSDSLAFLTMLAQAKDDQIPGFTEIEYDGERFRVKGDARTNAAVAALRQRLVTAGWSVEQPELTTRPDTTTLFVLKGKRGSTQP